MKLIKNILLWVVAVLLGITAFASLPSVAGILLLLCAAILLPIAKWQDLIKRISPAKWLKPIAAVLTFVIGMMMLPAAEPAPPMSGGNSSEIEQSSSITVGIGQQDSSSASSVAPPISSVSSSSKEEMSSSSASSVAPPISSVSPSSKEEMPSSSESSQTTSNASSNTTAPSNSTFAVHFIDVGQADASLVLCDGKAMLIDGGNAADSNLIYAYLKKHGITHLDYIVATHAHEDHIGGLPGALNFATIDHALCPVPSYDSKVFSNFVKYLERQNKTITVPAAGDTFKLGSATVQVLGPVQSSDEPNNTSLVLRVVYGETSFLFTGDAERAEELDILNAGYTLNSTVLKVGHHGSDTSTSYPFLREIMPQYAVVSVGTDNSYGHPTDVVLSRLRDADAKVYRTDLQGDILCTSDGKKVLFTVSKNENADTLQPGNAPQQNTSQPSSSSAASAEPPASSKPVSSGSLSSKVPASSKESVSSQENATSKAPVSSKAPASSKTESKPETEKEFTYVLNTSSKKFHYPTCRSVSTIKDKNRGSFTGTRDEIIKQGYDPCGNCDP